LNLKAISLACVIGLSTLVFSGCGNNNDNNKNGTTGNNGTNTSMKARSVNRGTTIDPMTSTRNGNGTTNYRVMDNGNGNGIGNGRGGLFGTGLMNGNNNNNMNGMNGDGLFGNGANNGNRNGNDMGMGNGNGYGRGGLFGTGIMNGIDEDNYSRNGLFGNGANDNRGGLFGTGMFNGNNDNNGRMGTGMNGIRSNGAGTSDSFGQSGRMSAQGNRGNGTMTGLNDRSQEYNDALVLGNLVIVGIDGDTSLGRGASTQAGNVTGSSAQHVLHVTNPQALKALQRVKQQLEIGNETQNTDKLAKDLATVLKHAKEPSVRGKSRNTGAGTSTGR
jgi:hypothetical protein